MRVEMREELGLLPDETMLLFVGQHIWEKNIGFILDALALIKEKPFHLFMVGTGYAVREIRNKISTLGLQDRVTLLGNIHDRERLKKIDAAADLFLFPSEKLDPEFTAIPPPLCSATETTTPSGSGE